MDQFPANIENPPNAQNPQQQAAQPPVQLKKKPRQTITLRAQHFEKENGIQALYKTIENTDFRRGEDNVDMTMKKITTILKTWHYQMLPKYSFDLFLQRCKALGNHKFTQSYMQKVRRIHKGQDSWGAQQPVNQENPLNNVNFENLNPNIQQGNQNYEREKYSEDKFQNFNKIPQKRQQRRMEIQADEMAKMQEMMDDDMDDDDEMMRQMEAMDTKIQEKKQLLAKSNKNNTPLQKNQQNNSESQQNPYIPEGFDMDYDQQSSYN